jgi:hypothetical protein
MFTTFSSSLHNIVRAKTRSILIAAYYILFIEIAFTNLECIM